MPAQRAEGTAGAAPVGASASRASAFAVVAFAAVIRVLVVVGGARFPPAADGTYYDTLARRIASGAGYTWLWPDGAVTPVAHYPVGYPALVALGYRLVAPSPVVAMSIAAILSTVAVAASFRILSRFGNRVAVLGALLVAVHPALLLYIPAMMTEGVTTSLLLVAAGLAVASREDDAKRGVSIRLALGVVLAALIYLRPQNLLLAPCFAFAAVPPSSARPSQVRSVAATLAVAALCVLPWTARNCVQMNKCALVSVNGGWNLLIGAETTNGAWQALQTPQECRTVWSEAGKDDCFGRAARREIAADLGAWIARAPTKTNVTFDYFGAAPWYLHESAPNVVDQDAKEKLGAVETIFSRLALLFALVAVARFPGRFARARIVLALLGAPFACMMHASLAYVALAASAALVALATAAEPAFFLTSAIIVLTLVIHAAFFGAGRYGLPVAAFVPLLSAIAVAKKRAMA